MASGPRLERCHRGFLATLHCSFCRAQPLRVRHRRDGVLLCGRCGDPLLLQPQRRPWPGLAGAVALLAALAALSNVVVAGLPRRAPLLPALAAVSGPAGLVGVSLDGLLQQLGEADQAWIPRAELLPDGRTRYIYKRRAGDPELTLAEIRALIAAPPSFRRERLAIAELVDALRRVGVRIELSQPRKVGAAGEWEPAQRVIRIQPRVVGKGSREFAKVLNHESIHVAQSCNGRQPLNSSPRPLGLSEALPPSLASVLNEPLYRQVSPMEQRLEREAYAHQERLGLGVALVRQHCPEAQR